jgi:hypothetical protein
VLIAGQDTAGEIAIDAGGQKIYWVNKGFINMNNGAVMRANRDGTAVETLAANQGFPLTLTLDATRVYWGTLNGGLFSANKDGSMPAIHVTPVLGHPPVSGVAVHGSYIYYSQLTELRRLPFGSMISSLVYDGSPEENPKEIRSDGQALYFVTTNGSGGKVFRLVP